MSNVWLSGAPSVVGWYPASIDRDDKARRHWNGVAWSAPVYAGDPLENWISAKGRPAEFVPGDEIVWQNDEDVRDQCERWLHQTCSERFVETQGAVSLLEAAAGHIRARAAAYDKPEGERSMAATVEAFNVITGRIDPDRRVKAVSLLIGLLAGCKATHRAPDCEALIEALEGALHYLGEANTSRPVGESEGWLFMELLKAVRDYTTKGGHADSQEDRIAYAALGAEARRAGR